VLYVCENNLYGQYTHVSKVMPVEHVADRACAYAMPSCVVDGNDVDLVYAAAAEMVTKIRGGAGPMLLECKTYRYLGHALGDPGDYRSKEELERWRAHDPILLARQRLQEEGLLDDDTAERIEAEIEEELKAAVAFAEASSYPDPEEDLLTDVYAPFEI
jgi:TPP-dependent pyruvate/acetoin dehydrogenase alpha subunit